MFPDVLQALKNYFGRDFLLGVFFPVLIFVGASLLLYFEITQGLAAALAGWEKLSLGSQVLLILVGLIVMLALSYLIFNFQYNITRLFEGYWPRSVDIIRDWRIEQRRLRWQYLENRNKLESNPLKKHRNEVEQYAFYPPRKHKDEVMPTQIGNILRNSELYAYDRYGIDSVIIWTRLRPLLADNVVAPLAESETSKNFMLLMCTLSVTFTLIWCPVLALSTTRWDLFLLCTIGWPLAWICYQNAVQSALAYGEQLKAVFDLHRYDLLTALKRPIPPNPIEERKEWNRLGDFFYWSVLPKPAPSPPDNTQSLDEVVKALAEFLKKVNSPTQ